MKWFQIVQISIGSWILWSLMASGLNQTISRERCERGQEYFEHGIFLLVENNKLPESLPFFRAAVRLNPLLPLYWLHLGQTEAKLNISTEKVRYRFQMCISLIDDLLQQQHEREGSDLSLGRLLEVDAKSQHHGVANAEGIASLLATRESAENSLLRLAEETMGAESALSQTGGSMADSCKVQINIEQLSPTSFQSRASTTPLSISPSRPHVFRGALYHWGWNLTALDPSVLARSPSLSAELTETYPQNMRAKPVLKSYSMSLQDSLTYLSFPHGAYVSVDASLAGTYIQWNMNTSLFYRILSSSGGDEQSILDLFEDDDPRNEEGNRDVKLRTGPMDCLDSSSSLSSPSSSSVSISDSFSVKTHWSMLLLAEKDAGMFFHVDDLSTSSWQAQVQGSKSWHFCPPLRRRDRHLETDVYGDIDFYPQFDTMFNTRQGGSRVKQFNSGHVADTGIDGDGDGDGDGDKCVPRDEEYHESITCYTVVVQAGDVVYYPRGWWHQTLSLHTPSVALSNSVLMAGDREAFITDMRKECSSILPQGSSGRGQAHRSQLSPRYKLSVEECFKLLNQCTEQLSTA